MEEDDQFMPDLNALLEVSLVEENVPSANQESTTDDDKTEAATEDNSKQPTEPSDEQQVPHELEVSQNADQCEPIANGSEALLQMPDFSGDEDLESRQLFKLSLLPKNISEEEKTFYMNAIENIKSVTCMRLHCTVCSVHIGCHLEAVENTFSHCNLYVLMCKECYVFYGNGDFTCGPDGSETYCFWCGQGGQVYCCSTCPHVFCKKCVRLNFGRKTQREIELSSDWACYTCNPRALWEYRAQCWGLQTFNEMRKNNMIMVSPEEEQWSPGYNIAECCNIQKRAGKPLKILSYRFMKPLKEEPPEKKQQTRQKETEVQPTKKSKSPSSTSNGKVRFSFKPQLKSLLTAGKANNSKRQNSASPAGVKSHQSEIRVKSPGVINTTVYSSLSQSDTSDAPTIIPNSDHDLETVPKPENAQKIKYINKCSISPKQPTLTSPACETVTCTTKIYTVPAERIQPVPKGNYLLVSSPSSTPPKLLPITTSNPPKLLPVTTISNVVRPNENRNKTSDKRQPVVHTEKLYESDDDDVIIIDDELFENAVKKLECEWFVKSLEQAEKISKVIQQHCETIKKNFSTEVKNNKVDAKRVRCFTGKLHHLLKRAAVKLACLDEKNVSEAFSDWLKAQKLKHQKPVRPASPKERDVFLDMEISCESEEEEDSETIFQKSVEECPDTLSDIEFEDKFLTNVASGVQRKLLLNSGDCSKQATSSPKTLCDVCIQTDQTEPETTSFAKDTTEPECSSAYSDNLTNHSESNTLIQNGTNSLPSDKTSSTVNEHLNSTEEIVDKDYSAEEIVAEDSDTPVSVESLKRVRSPSPNIVVKKKRMESPDINKLSVQEVETENMKSNSVNKSYAVKNCTVRLERI